MRTAEVLHVRIANDRFLSRHVSSAVPTSTMRWLGRDLVPASGVLIRARCHRECDEGLFCIDNSLSAGSSSHILTMSACACTEVVPGDALKFVGAEARSRSRSVTWNVGPAVGRGARGFSTHRGSTAEAHRGKTKHRMPWAQRSVTSGCHPYCRAEVHKQQGRVQGAEYVTRKVMTSLTYLGIKFQIIGRNQATFDSNKRRNMPFKGPVPPII